MYFRFTVLLVSFVCCVVFLNDRLAAVNNSGNHPVLYCSLGIWIFFSSSKLQFLLYVEISKLSEELNSGFVIITISSPVPVHLLCPLGNRAQQNASIPSGENVTAFLFPSFPDHLGLLFLEHYGLLLSNSGLLWKHRQTRCTASPFWRKPTPRAQLLLQRCSCVPLVCNRNRDKDFTASVFYRKIAGGLQQKTAINSFWSHRNIFHGKLFKGVQVW